MTAWHSLYLPSDDRAGLLASLREILAALDYSVYDPFTHWQPGDAYPRTVKLFVAPATGGWLRVIGEPDEALLPRLSARMPLLHLALDGERDHAAFYASRERCDLIPSLRPWLRPGCSETDLRRAMLQVESAAAGEPRPAEAAHTSESELAAASLELLPDALREQAGRLNPKQVNRLFNRMMRRVNRSVGGEQDRAARALLANAPDWDSTGGRRLRALAACLTLPEDWRTPDFIALRDAYQRHLRRQQRPHAPLLPGDEAQMQQVPNALDYTPLYAGKAD